MIHLEEAALLVGAGGSGSTTCPLRGYGIAGVSLHILDASPREWRVC